ncbi:F0F1 ATP synthase subunit B [Candidatus Synchoanobacter obligatus]|uniref:ATP synthase subunit b n=1 Tax=Candidatus Synchoanobacter obligatus TaxID=2919597 RepID=A0ABT1L715_9GAMM|nr:F0F1 ATP synthase subunit B [Candidatus Synchoanobacter obligatus]MCP8352183.1 F0F1 ATP synthase subunit B [Candidatus Synchoanobacter obligatus]
MNINATLLVEMVVFASFVGLTRIYLWPPLIEIIEKRQADIAQGVEDAKRGKTLLSSAEKECADMVQNGQKKSKRIIDQAEMAAQEILDDARRAALNEEKKQLTRAQEKIDQQVIAAHQTLEKEVLVLVKAALAKVIPNLPDDSLVDPLIVNAIKEAYEEN